VVAAVDEVPEVLEISGLVDADEALEKGIASIITEEANTVYADPVTDLPNQAREMWMLQGAAVENPQGKALSI